MVRGGWKAELFYSYLFILMRTDVTRYIKSTDNPATSFAQRAEAVLQVVTHGKILRIMETE